MKNFFINDLLPEGFKVLLPEQAHKEEIISRSILDLFFQNVIGRSYFVCFYGKTLIKILKNS